MGDILLNMKKTSGNRGDKIRSDCWCSVELTNSGGVDIRIRSKVATLFGDEIEKLTKDVCRFFGIKNAIVEMEDKGALNWVIAARLEAAVRNVMEIDEGYLFPTVNSKGDYHPNDAARFSRLYIPGNSPKLMLNAGIYGAHGIILDLEDAVAPDKKAEARILVRNALRSVDFYGTERMVRINQLPAGLEDLDFIVEHGVQLILIPKCEKAEDVKAVDERIKKLSDSDNVIYLMPIIESALGVVNAYEIASASQNVVAVAIGLEDYTASIGAQRTDEGRESFYARSAVVNAARAAGVQPIDSVFSEFENMELLKANALSSKSLGFEGMGCIHPAQVKVVNEAFSPNRQEIEKAQKIVQAYEDAIAKGLGVVSLGTKMIDAPVVKRAQKILEVAKRIQEVS
jgi:citrate lyase subunit beta/citryl-CoA lyase